MKKLLWLLLVCLLVIFSGCSNETKSEGVSSQAQESKAESNKEPEKAEQSNTKSPVDGIEFTVTGIEKQGVVKGTEVTKELSWDKGSYIIGKNKPIDVNEYEVLMVSVEVKNDTDKVINLSEMGWGAKLPDGYELMFSMELGFSGQVRSADSKEGKVKIIIDKSFNADRLLLVYNYLNYNEEWSKALNEAITGKMTPEEYLKKYTPIPIEWELTI